MHRGGICQSFSLGIRREPEPEEATIRHRS
jgi:hypothetical protein